MPGQQETLDYIKYITMVNLKSRCHTLDRYDMKAQLECGIGDTSDFQSAVNMKFKFEHWSWSNNDYIFNCM